MTEVISVRSTTAAEWREFQDRQKHFSFEFRRRRQTLRGKIVGIRGNFRYDVLIPGRAHPYDSVPCTEPVDLPLDRTVTLAFLENNPGLPVILCEKSQLGPRIFLGEPPAPIPVHYWPFYRQSPTRGSTSSFEGFLGSLFQVTSALTNRSVWKIRVWEDQIFALSRNTSANNDSTIHRFDYARNHAIPWTPQTGVIPYIADFAIDPFGEEHDLFVVTVNTANETVGMVRLSRDDGFRPWGAGSLRIWESQASSHPYRGIEQKMIVSQDDVSVVFNSADSPTSIVQTWSKEDGSPGTAKSLPRWHPPLGKNTAYKSLGYEFMGERRKLRDWDPSEGFPGFPVLPEGGGGGSQVLPYVSGGGVYPSSPMGESSPVWGEEYTKFVIHVPHLKCFLPSQDVAAPYLRCFREDGTLAWEVDGDQGDNQQKLFRPLVSTSDGRVIVHTVKLAWETVRWHDADITEMPLPGLAAGNIRERERESRIVTTCHEYLEIYRATNGELLESQKTTEKEIVTKAYVPTGGVKVVTPHVRVLPGWENIGGVNTPVLEYPNDDKDLLDPPARLYEIEGDYTERPAATYISPLLAPRYLTPWHLFPESGPSGRFLGRPQVVFGDIRYEHYGRLPLDPGIDNPRAALDNYVDTVVERGEGAEFWSGVVAQGTYYLPNPDWDGEDPDYEFVDQWFAFKLGWSAREVVTRISEPAVFGTERAYVSHDGKLLILEPRFHAGIEFGFKLGDLDQEETVPYVAEALLEFSYPSFLKDEEGDNEWISIETNTSNGCRAPHYLNEDDFKPGFSWLVALNLDPASETHNLLEEVWRVSVPVSAPGQTDVSNVVSTADGRTVVMVGGPRRPMTPPSSNYSSEAKIYLYEIDTASGDLLSEIDGGYWRVPTISWSQEEGDRSSLILSGGMAILARHAEVWGCTTPPPPYSSF